MSNLSSDYKHSVTEPQVSDAQTRVLITYSDGSRFQYEVALPTTNVTDLLYWYSSQKFLIAYEYSHSAHGTGTCVSTVPTYINMAHVSQIKEIIS